MQRETAQFLELLRPVPGYKVLDVTAHADALTLALAEFLSPVGGSVDAVLYPGIHETVVHPRITCASVETFDRPFKAPARSYDVVIFRDILDRHRFAERMVRLGYTTLANAAVIIIVQRKGSLDGSGVMELLDRCEFRAANRVEIFADSDLFVARKMHMWGNGL